MESLSADLRFIYNESKAVFTPHVDTSVPFSFPSTQQVNDVPSPLPAAQSPTPATPPTASPPHSGTPPTASPPHPATTTEESRDPTPPPAAHPATTTKASRDPTPPPPARATPQTQPAAPILPRRAMSDPPATPKTSILGHPPKSKRVRGKPQPLSKGFLAEHAPKSRSENKKHKLKINPFFQKVFSFKIKNQKLHH